MKKQLYPKTKRISDKKCIITEKLDGSNIGFFRLNDDLIIATRNNVFKLSEIEENKDFLYKGMRGWLDENGIKLRDSLNDKSGIFGEWIGMGCLKYPELDKKIYMFAKANITDEFEATNIIYDHELFIYPFIEKEIPNFTGVVPIVTEFEMLPTKSKLDNLYEDYKNKVDRNVEGFVISTNNDVKKYVRMKNGNLEEYKESVKGE